ncbi:stage V sporulation protein AD [Desulforamulus aeronauticus DSM 10349]|uniref:Stage V sporulation protein AD n=1 Tax=Desulforamulus aeronauticus DSM 10349 TaxID=1121421 RepID=A0A1M6PCF9_9FIRM|nr:stage V sporulation protein AD [Desulforamulus aeronauticus DSM 10349]
MAFQQAPVILSHASIVGPKEGEGPLGDVFDKVLEDMYYEESTWEKAEQKIFLETMKLALAKAQLTTDDMDYLLAGDLTNQIITANFTARSLAIPFIGLYGACSTMYESLALGSMLIDGGYAKYVLVGASSHFATAERQFRFPTEQGVQRAMSAQRTVTGAGAIVLGAQGEGPRITHATIGKVIDFGQGDASDMGSAMAPAAADTFLRHLQDRKISPDFYSIIATGDLGKYGRQLVVKLCEQQEVFLTQSYTDCGILIFDESQDTHAGGSGCGCSAVVTCGHLLREMEQGRLTRILGIGTGALLSPCSSQQGETIPGIAHAVAIEASGGGR